MRGPSWLLPKGTTHGPKVLHMCHGCFTMATTYEGDMPRRWRKIGAWEFCPRCARREEER